MPVSANQQPAAPARVLAVDVGDRRIGLALSDETRTLASPLQVLRGIGPRQDVEAVVRVAAAHDVATIVVGVPRRLDGSVGEQGLKCLAFAERLRRLGDRPVVEWDESLSTADARARLLESGARRARRRESVDARAAAVFLQAYLDSLARPGATSAQPDPSAE